jgi:hypothetical protein
VVDGDRPAVVTDDVWISDAGAAVLAERMQGRGWRVMDTDQRVVAMDLARQRAEGFVWLGDLAGFGIGVGWRRDSRMPTIFVVHRCGWDVHVRPGAYVPDIVQMACDHLRAGCPGDGGPVPADAGGGP